MNERVTKAVRAAACCVLMGLGAEASGAALTWINGAGGSASTAGNWAPAQVPTGADSLTFSLNLTYTVTWTGAAAASLSQTVRDGAVTYSILSPHTCQNGLIVGDIVGSSAQLTLTTGTLTANNSVFLGSAGTAVGTLNVNDDDAALITAGGASDLIVGNGGLGFLNVTGGGLVQLADDLQIGSGASAGGTVVVEGFLLFPPANSTIRTTSATTGDMIVGFGGEGLLDIRDGGRAISADDVFVAHEANSVGELYVNQNGNDEPLARLQVADDLFIGSNENSSMAGAGNLLLGDIGEVIVGDHTQVGDVNGNNGFAGYMLIDNGGLFTTRSLTVNPATGILDLQCGVLTIDGGVFSYSLPDFTIYEFGCPDQSIIELRNGASWSLPGKLAVGGDDVSLSGDTGLRVLSGSTLNANSMDSSANEFATADILVDGAGSKLDVATFARIGGNGTLPDGSTIMTVSNSSELEANSMTVYSTGDVVMNGGLLDVAGALALEAGSTLSGSGTVSAGGFFHSGSISATGAGLTFTGPVTAFSGTISGTKITIAPSGSLLRIGSTASTLDCAGTLRPGGASLAGVINVPSLLQMQSTANLVIRLGGRTVSLCDRVDVNGGPANLDGKLTVSLINGYNPPAGAVFTAVSAAAINGEFSAVSGPQGMRVDYYPNQVLLVMTNCFADVTHDGQVNIDDLTHLILNWNGSDPDADVDGDNVVEIDDLTAVILGWGACP